MFRTYLMAGVRRLTAVAALAAGLSAAGATPAAAAPLITVPDTTVTAPGTGSTAGFFDVTISPNGTPSIPPVSAFLLRLNLTPGSPQTVFTFGAPYVQKPANYIFGAADTPQNPSGSPSTSYTINASGLLADAGAGKTLDGTYGLVRVPFTVTGPVATTQVFSVTVNTTFTELSDADANVIPIVAAKGTVTVRPVPEPAGAAMLAAAGGLAALRRRRHRRPVAVAA